MGFPRYTLCLDIAHCFFFDLDYVHTSSFRLWPNDLVNLFYNKLVSEQGLEEEMDDSLGGMFKLTGSSYFVWKSKMRDMLVVKDLWLPI